MQGAQTGSLFGFFNYTSKMASPMYKVVIYKLKDDKIFYRNVYINFFLYMLKFSAYRPVYNALGMKAIHEARGRCRI